MSKSLKNQARPIIEEFAKEIEKVKISIQKDKDPIPFRNDEETKTIRDAFMVPIEYLRFRKDNGRIASDVLTYEFNKGELNETTDYGQSLLKEYLEKKDPPENLKNLILKSGQKEYAVITCDGFLINGNRRRMVFENLLEEHPGDEKYKYMKVVILPGANDKPPTFLEIEQLENRYQYQSDGKAEYYNFDKALSIKRKMEMGMTLEEQLRDDANYRLLTPAKFEKEKAKFQDEYLNPLICIDTYLKYLNRPGHYNTVSEGKGDNEGRWQAFLDYYKTVYKKLIDENQRIKMGVQEDEIGTIEDIAFKIIRKREIGGLNKKVHEVMRDLPKLLKNPNSKKELFKLSEIDFNLTTEESTEDDKPISEKLKDKLWGNKYATEIGECVREAYRLWEQKKEQDTPIDLLNAALGNLNHSNMKNLKSIDTDRISEAISLAKDIQIRANEIESQLSQKTAKTKATTKKVTATKSTKKSKPKSKK